jgi:hypothetical protein
VKQPRDRFPRSMKEAFGPYTDDKLEAMCSKKGLNWSIIWACVGIVLLGILYGFLFAS